MLETFKARLKAKSTAAGANLSAKRINAIADKLHKKFPEITEESEHDAKIDDIYDVDELKEIAKTDDRLRTLEAKEKIKTSEQIAVEEEAKKKADIEKDMPEWFKSYKEENDKRLNTLLQEKTEGSIKQKLASHEKLKGIDAKLYAKWKLPEKEEDIDGFANEVAETYGSLIKPDEAPTSFLPGMQRQPTSGVKKVDSDLVNFAKHKTDQAVKSPQTLNKGIITSNN